jgi:hypothetical protein
MSLLIRKKSSWTIPAEGSHDEQIPVHPTASERRAGVRRTEIRKLPKYFPFSNFLTERKEKSKETISPARATARKSKPFSFLTSTGHEGKNKFSPSKILSRPANTMTWSPLRILFMALCPYRTSGASDTIFMNFSVRSSRVTGPKMRVPMGSSLLLSSTAALPSNLMREPSPRRMPLAVRTTTAL